MVHLPSLGTPLLQCGGSMNKPRAQVEADKQAQLARFLEEGAEAYWHWVQAHPTGHGLFCPLCGKKLGYNRSGFCKEHIPAEVRELIRQKNHDKSKAKAPSCLPHDDPRYIDWKTKHAAHNPAVHQDTEAGKRWLKHNKERKFSEEGMARLRKALHSSETKRKARENHPSRKSHAQHEEWVAQQFLTGMNTSEAKQRAWENNPANPAHPQHTEWKVTHPSINPEHERHAEVQARAHEIAIKVLPQCRSDGSFDKEDWRGKLHQGMRRAAHQPKKGKFRWGADSPEEEHLMDLQLSYVELLKKSVPVSYRDGVGKHHTFFPDFRIKGRLIEYKGDCYLRGLREKNAHTSYKLQCEDVGFVPTSLSPLFEYCLQHEEWQGHTPIQLANACFSLWQRLEHETVEKAVRQFRKLSLETQAARLLEVTTNS